MYKKRRKIFIWLLGLIGISSTAFTQELVIELGKKNIALDEPFAITLIIRNAQTQNTHSPFPDISGMQKREVALVNSKEEFNGKYIITQRITQYYLAEKIGSYVLKPFKLTVNRKEVKSPGINITVTPPKNELASDTLTSKLYNEILSLEKDLSHKKENAFLALSTSTNTVFLGEGFTVTLALFVAENNQVELKSFQEGTQLLDILRKLKPPGCWEQDFNIREFQMKQVTVNRKKYTQYKLYQAAFYPINTDTIRFPEVSFRMIKIQASTSNVKNQADTVTFFSQPQTVYVKPLPVHPLKEGIAVGNFRLEESVSRRQLQTGQSFTYEFRVIGEGNLSAVNVNPVNAGGVVDFYPPEIRSQVSTQQDQVSGSKIFRFTGVPREPGQYPLYPVFQLVFFNPAAEVYDTLASRIVLEVTGESLRNSRISASQVGAIYRNLASESNRLRPLQQEDSMRNIASALLILMMVVTIVLISYKKQ